MGLNPDVLILIIATFSMLTSMLVIVMYMKRNRESVYDYKNNRIQLEKMRMHYEEELYNLNRKLAANNERWIDTNHLVFSGNSQTIDSNINNNVIQSSKFLAKHGLKEKEFAVNPKKVFVLTSFLESEIEKYYAVRTTCLDIGLECSKSDDEYIKGDVLSHIIKSIAEARIVLANIDGRNPNVFYELGIAHALDKPTILISQSDNELPFDLQSKNVLFYKNLHDLDNKLRKELTRTIINNG
ncbi:hypothetical protein G9298_18965 [Bacillus thuringiensis]|nr:hypothetical protein G9298_18965 [Bacillus thuringiensis]